LFCFSRFFELNRRRNAAEIPDFHRIITAYGPLHERNRSCVLSRTRLSQSVFLGRRARLFEARRAARGRSAPAVVTRRSLSVIRTADADQVLGWEASVESVECRVTSSRRHFTYSLNAFTIRSQTLSCSASAGSNRSPNSIIPEAHPPQRVAFRGDGEVAQFAESDRMIYKPARSASLRRGPAANFLLAACKS
jgi:hypothetical protein